jgi:hypothetical protein
MDFTKAGLKEGFKRAIKVIFYVALSGAITSLIAYFKPMETSEYGIVFALVNSFLAGAEKWVTTKK